VELRLGSEGCIEEAEEEFLEQDYWIGEPEYSVEVILSGKRSVIEGSDLNVIAPYLEDLEVFTSFRAVSQQDYRQLRKQSRREVGRVEEEFSEAVFSHPADRLAAVYEEIGNIPYTHHKFDAEVDGLEEILQEAEQVEESMRKSRRFSVQEVGLKGYSAGKNAVEEFESIQENLSLNVYFRYSFGRNLRGYEEVNGTVELGDGEPNIVIPRENGRAEEEIVQEFIEIYGEDEGPKAVSGLTERKK
jgi:hypothetical protein